MKMSPQIVDGMFRVNWPFCRTMLVKGNEAIFHGTNGQDYPATIELGNFGDLDEAMAKQTDVKKLNIKITMNIGEIVRVFEGVLREDGKQIVIKSGNGNSVLDLMTEEEVESLEADGDPFEAPPGPYKVQPEKTGRLLWITGAPGLGKSTSAQLLAKTEGFVYYEADCFTSCKNPYVPLDQSNPSIGQKHQKPLIGKGLKERQELLGRSANFWQKIMTGAPYDERHREEFYTGLCENIKKERARIGGDWAVAAVALNKDWRDWIRSCIPDVIFVILDMKRENVRKRLTGRHEDQKSEIIDMLMKFHDKFEVATEEEEKCVNIFINEDMDRMDVIKEIMDRT